MARIANSTRPGHHERFPRSNENQTEAGRTASPRLNNTASLKSEIDVANFSTAERGSTLVVKFGDSQILDETYCQSVGLKLTKLTESMNGKSILLNFAKVKFLASAMIGQLVNLRNQCESANIKLGMCNINENVTEAITLMRLDKIFKNFESEDEALEALGSGA